MFWKILIILIQLSLSVSLPESHKLCEIWMKCTYDWEYTNILEMLKVAYFFCSHALKILNLIRNNLFSKIWCYTIVKIKHKHNLIKIVLQYSLKKIQNSIASFMNTKYTILTKGKCETSFLPSLAVFLRSRQSIFTKGNGWIWIPNLITYSFILFYLGEWQWYIRLNKPYPVLNTFLVLKANRAESWMGERSAPAFTPLFVSWKALMEETW